MVSVLSDGIRWASLWTDWSVWPYGLTCFWGSSGTGAAAPGKLPGKLLINQAIHIMSKMTTERLNIPVCVNSGLFTSKYTHYTDPVYIKFNVIQRTSRFHPTIHQLTAVISASPITTREPSYREVSARQQCVYEGPWKKSTFSRSKPTLAPYNQPARLSAKRLRSNGHFRKCGEYPLLM